MPDNGTAKREGSGGMDFSPSGQRHSWRFNYHYYLERHEWRGPDGLKSIPPPEKRLVYLVIWAPVKSLVNNKSGQIYNIEMVM